MLFCCFPIAGAPAHHGALHTFATTNYCLCSLSIFFSLLLKFRRMFFIWLQAVFCAVGSYTNRSAGSCAHSSFFLVCESCGVTVGLSGWVLWTAALVSTPTHSGEQWKWRRKSFPIGEQWPWISAMERVQLPGSSGRKERGWYGLRRGGRQSSSIVLVSSKRSSGWPEPALVAGRAEGTASFPHIPCSIHPWVGLLSLVWLFFSPSVLIYSGHEVAMF